MHTSKFTLNKGKLDFHMKKDQTDKEYNMYDVKSLDALLSDLLLTFNMSVFDLVGMFKESLATNILFPTDLPKGKRLKLALATYEVGDGATLGQVLASQPQETVDNLKTFYYSYFEKEFSKAYRKHLGSSE